MATDSNHSVAPSSNEISNPNKSGLTRSLLKQLFQKMRSLQRFSRFLELPLELQLIVLEFCDDGALEALARTCRQMTPIAHEVLYRDLNFQSGIEFFLQIRGLYHRMSMIKLTKNFRVREQFMNSKICGGPPNLIEIVDSMDSLQTLELVYDRISHGEDDEYLDWHIMWLPLKLAQTLVSCSVELFPVAAWNLKDAKLLFQHPPLKRLRVRAPCIFHDTFSGDWTGQTCLEELIIVDGRNIRARDLSRLLKLPLALKYLSICSGFGDIDINSKSNEVDDGEYFKAIEESTSSDSLLGLRFDLVNQKTKVIPAAGAHLLLRIKYFETHVNHLYQQIESLGTEIHDHKLFPPSMEVLKVSGCNRQNSPHIQDILERIVREKKQDRYYLPHLKKVILCYQYRDHNMAAEISNSVLNADEYTLVYPWKERFSKRTEFILQTYKPAIDELTTSCREVGIELLLLFEDRARMFYMKEGEGKAVWEIDGQRMDKDKK